MGVKGTTDEARSRTSIYFNVESQRLVVHVVKDAVGKSVGASEQMVFIGYVMLPQRPEPVPHPWAWLTIP